MMATLRLRYVHAFVDKTGRARYYFRYRGKRWPLPGEPGTSEFTERYDALRRECSTVKPANNVAFGPGTAGFVIEKYLASGSRPSQECVGDSAALSEDARPTERDLRPRIDC